MEFGVVAMFFFCLHILLKYAFMFPLVLTNLVSSYELFIPRVLAIFWVFLWTFHELLMCNVHFVCKIKSCWTKPNAMDHGGVCYYQLWISPIATSLVRGTICFLPLSFCFGQILAINWLWFLVKSCIWILVWARFVIFIHEFFLIL
jgi:hypothetical protein